MSSSNRSELVHWFAPCPRGLEPALVEELNACGAQRIQPTAGGVAFAGAADLAYRVNLRSRVASRVLRRVAEAPYQQEDDIFRLAGSVNW
ncbi:MAG: class I SAM-dependent RNA methyltransferase, partial [Burkholderiales bacterium]